MTTNEQISQRIDAIREATNGLPTQLTRDEYESACASAGVAPRTDAEIVRGRYGIMNADYSYSDDPSGTAEIGQRINAARLRAIEREKAAGRPAPTAPAYIACPHCGNQTMRSQLMSASTGTACPNCYDSMSE